MSCVASQRSHLTQTLKQNMTVRLLISKKTTIIPHIFISKFKHTSHFLSQSQIFFIHQSFSFFVPNPNGSLNQQSSSHNNTTTLQHPQAFPFLQLRPIGCCFKLHLPHTLTPLNPFRLWLLLDCSPYLHHCWCCFRLCSCWC